MNKVIIGLIVTVVVGGGIVIFSNIDDLVSKNLEEATNEIEFSNPLQTYSIDSKCDLSYFVLDLMSKEKPLSSTYQVDLEETEQWLKDQVTNNPDKISTLSDSFL